MQSGTKEYSGIVQALEKEPFVICPVHGDSMYPFINEDRDFVRLEKPSGVLAQYDLPLYRRPGGKLVLHRIIEVREGYYVICGDNRSSREIVPYDWVVAVSTGVIKDGRYISADSAEYRDYLQKNVIGVEPEKRVVRHKILGEWHTVLSLCSAMLGHGAVTVREDCFMPRLFRILRSLSLADLLYPYLPSESQQTLEGDFLALCSETENLRAEEKRILNALTGAGISLALLGLWHSDPRLVGVYGSARIGTVLVREEDCDAVDSVMSSLGYIKKSVRPGYRLFFAASGGADTDEAVTGRSEETPLFAVFSDSALPERLSFDAVSSGSENGGEKLILPSRRDIAAFLCGGFDRLYMPIVTSLVVQMWFGERSDGSEQDGETACGKLTDSYDMPEGGADTSGDGAYRCGTADCVRASAALAQRLFSEPYPEYAELIKPFGGAGMPPPDEPTEEDKRIAARSQTLMGRLFPGFSVMKLRYPVLFSTPALLPLCWCHRLFAAAARRIGGHRR